MTALHAKFLEAKKYEKPAYFVKWVGLGVVRIVRKNSESKMQIGISQTILLTWMVPFYLSSRFQPHLIHW